MSRTRALRAPCGEENWVFSALGVILTPKAEKTRDLWQRQTRSAEALPLIQRTLTDVQENVLCLPILMIKAEYPQAVRPN